MSLILDGTSGLSDVDGTAAAPAIRGTDTNTGIFFPAADTIAFSEGGVEVARIDASGNVGIGTSSLAANAKLQVVGNMFCSSGNIFTPINSGIFFSGTPNTYTSGIFSTNTLDVAINTNGAERARIDSSGNLLVGTTSQINAGMLCVKGVGSNDCINTAPPTASTYISARFCGSTGGTIGYISTSTTATSYVTGSDYRLKEAIAPMTGALAKVAALKPVSYKWKLDGSNSQGFIAHELQAVVPECVVGEKDAVDADGNPQYQGIDTSFLVATLSAAIQELHALVKTQDNTITALTARITALEAAA